MSWNVLEHPEFVVEREELDDEVAQKLDALILSSSIWPQLGRPYVDTLSGSGHANMKEMRFKIGGVWRFAFAFDEERNAVILVGGDKQGQNQKRFYKDLIAVADRRFDEWLAVE